MRRNPNLKNLLFDICDPAHVFFQVFVILFEVRPEIVEYWSMILDEGLTSMHILLVLLTLIGISFHFV